MSDGRRLTSLSGRLRHPRTTVRWRLTLLYGALFLVSGAALLAITYTLVDNAAVFPQRPAFAILSGDAPFPSSVVGPHVRPGVAQVRRVPPALQRLPQWFTGGAIVQMEPGDPRA